MATLADFATEPQETYLTPESVARLQALKSLPGITSSRLESHMKQALMYVRQSAEDINDRGHQERILHANKLKRMAKDDEVETDEAAAAHEEFQSQVKQMTRKLDLATRQVIDQRTWVEDVPSAINRVVKGLPAGRQSSTQTQTQTQMTIDQSDSVGQVNDDSVAPAIPEMSQNPTTLLETVIAEDRTSREAQSLTTLYTTDNDYIDFYSTVFDANHADKNGPVRPDASEWFAEEEGRAIKKQSRNPQKRENRTQQGDSWDDENVDVVESDAESMSDIEVQAERVSLKCPFTMRYFEEPMKSLKCPHAFEKKHILDFIHKSTERAPATPQQQEELSQITQTQQRTRREAEIRPRVVRCPECGVLIAEADLRPDPVLVRMVKREVDKQRREEEQLRGGDAEIDDAEASEDDDIPVGNQRRRAIALGSSPAQSNRSRLSGINLKTERSSVVPQTQFSQSRSVADEEEEEEEDEDTMDTSM